MIPGTRGIQLEYPIIPVSAKKFKTFMEIMALVELKGSVKHDLIDIYFAFIKPTLYEGEINMNIMHGVYNIKMI
jgi:hypothetical protein